MNWWDRFWRLIGCSILATIAAMIIPILVQLVIAAIQVATGAPPPCDDILARIAQAFGIPCTAYQAVVQAYWWLMVIGFAAILLGLIILVVRCFISVFRREDEEEDSPQVTLACNDVFGVGQGACLQPSL